MAFGAAVGALAFVAILAAVNFAGVGWAMRTDRDASWLPRWVVLGFIAKTGGTLASY